MLSPYIYIYLMLSNTPVSFLSGVLAVNANRKNVARFLTSNFAVVDRRRS